MIIQGSGFQNNLTIPNNQQKQVDQLITDSSLNEINTQQPSKQKTIKNNDLSQKYLTWNSILSQSNLLTLDENSDKSNDFYVESENNNVFLIVGETFVTNFKTRQHQVILERYQAEIVKHIKPIKATVLKVPINLLGDFYSDCKTLPSFEYLEPNAILTVDGIPNDTNWTEQCGPQRIHAPEAWAIESGNLSDVLVCVIDTGIDYTHPELSTRYLNLGYDWVNDDNDPMDDHSHGIHCAGTIAATINNSLGIAGMANVSLMAEKFLSASGSGSTTDAIEAVLHAVDAGADIISNSWGGGGYSEALEDAFEYAYNHNVVCIAAAGNSATSTPQYPSYYSNVIAVSATNNADQLASFSNYGSHIDVAAPGVDILSTVPTSMGSYDYMSGTSMACPHVAGVAALIKSAFPE